MSTIRIATRGSALARTQSAWVGEQIAVALGSAVDLVIVRTEGDRVQDRPLAEIGGKGLFVKEVEEAILDGRADLAVHSAKDLPAEIHPELALAAHPQRADARDALVVRAAGTRLDTLPRGGRVGTGSVRRRAELLAHRADLDVVPLRGNVDTRLRKLDEDGLDAVVLACAGLERLGLADRIDERLDPGVMLPAPTQGALALEARAGGELAEALRAIDHGPTRVAVAAERGFLSRLGGDCRAPLAAFCEPAGPGRIRLRGRILSLDGSRCAEVEAEAPAAEAAWLGRQVAEAALAKGGAEILAALGIQAPAL